MRIALPCGMDYSKFDEILARVSERYGWRYFKYDKEGNDHRGLWRDHKSPGKHDQGFEIWLDQPDSNGQTRVHVIKSGFKKTEQVFSASPESFESILKKCIALADEMEAGS